MKNAIQENPFKVVEIVKFGMIFGFGVKELETGKIIYEFDCDQKDKAESKCELKNLLALNNSK
jgi:hypothetical protein